MKKLISLVCGISVAVALASCGGGDSPAATTTATTTPTTTTPASVALAATDATRYSGNWAVCRGTGAATSARETIAITATSATTLAFTDTETLFAALNCTGAAGTTKTSTGTVAFNGTKTVGADTVDKVIVTQGTQTQKQILLVTATTLKTGKGGSDGGPIDADGYPTTFDGTPFTKQ